jgi:hypothetical protein
MALKSKTRTPIDKYERGILMKPRVVRSPITNPAKPKKKDGSLDDTNVGRTSKGKAAAGAGASGREAYMTEARGRRGAKHDSGKDWRYKKGKYKGMTQGEADGVDLARYRKMPEHQRDKFRSVNAADRQRNREGAIQAAKDAAKVARESQRDIRQDVRDERKKYGDESVKANKNKENEAAVPTYPKKPSPVKDASSVDEKDLKKKKPSPVNNTQK